MDLSVAVEPETTCFLCHWLKPSLIDYIVQHMSRGRIRRRLMNRIRISPGPYSQAIFSPLLLYSINHFEKAATGLASIPELFDR
jgi:predicted membrane metal-binding protein